MRPPALFLVGALAVGLFVPLMARGGLGPLDFWWGMAVVNVALIGLAFLVDRGYPGRILADLRDRPALKVLLGLALAAALYLVFFVGNVLSRLILPGAGEAIGEVYALKEGASTARIALLMGFVFGPGEELFWRGYLQHGLAARYGRWTGFMLATALYAGVHLGSGNPMLVIAALTCGLAWGWVYLRFGSITVAAVSHTIWDLAVFLVFPFQD